MFNRKPKPLNIPEGSGGIAVLTEIINRSEDFGLTETQRFGLSHLRADVSNLQEKRQKIEKTANRMRDLLVYWRACMASDQREIVDDIIKEFEEIPNSLMANSSASLSSWFGFSRASFAVLPRVLMSAMSDRWQGKMASLMREYDAKWCNVPNEHSSFLVRGEGPKGQMAKLPEVFTNYKYPDHKTLALWSRQPINDFKQFCTAVNSLSDEYLSDDQIMNLIGSEKLSWELAESVAT